MDYEKRIGELRQVLTEYQRAYYVSGRSLVSDLEYDGLFDELLALENKYPHLKTPDSPTQRVGSDLSADFPEVSHTIPVLSLDKAYSDGEILSWADKTIKNTGEDLSFVLEEKIDGFSIVLYYKEGILEKAVTRGNGFVGNDVTANVKTIYSVPLKLTKKVDIAVRGEVYLPIEHFQKINASMEEPYANPRNLAAGTIRRNKSSETASVPLSIFVYEGFWSQGAPFTDHIEIMAELKELGFNVNPNISYFCKTAQEAKMRLERAGLKGKGGSFDQIPLAIADNTTRRRSLPYEIDGLVIKVNELATRESLGYTEHHPRWAIAYKFEAPQAQTTVKDIDVQVGRTGRITPMARIQETKLSGSTIKNITLHNQDYINTLELAIGDFVSISKRGDVIPAVESVIDKNELGNTTWKIPDLCPVCSSVLVKKGAHHFCENFNCPAREKGRLVFFCGKDQMDMEGFGPKTIDVLYDNDFVKNIGDLFKFQYGYLNGMEGFGEESKKVDTLKKAIADAKKTSFRKVLVSLGIPEFGKRAVDLVVEAGYDNINKFLSLTADDISTLSAIRNIGPVTASLIVEGFNDPNIRTIIEDLQKAGLSMKEGEKTSDNLAFEQIFKGQSWCVTGTFDNFNPRGKAMEEVVKRGGIEVSSVSSKTTCLLAGKNAGSKLKKAQDLGVKIVTEDEFLVLIAKKEFSEEAPTLEGGQLGLF
ncbi:MAG: NAD-dependent DNA ligase LigA [Sphaerochaetaceae bacterium]|nr:NAD-dependent DNA ligase LigA [Sphaerochaetaceae bacterium]